MKLIMENAVALEGSIEDELNESSGSTERNYYISGIFSTPEAKNRNGRVYSRSIWEREVLNYQKEIKSKSVNTLGEWQHPARSTVDPLKAVLRIVELKINEEGNVWGKAKILNDNTDQTNKLKGLIKEGIKIGVSSRGVGKVSATGVVENFKLITYDAVDLPSDYNAMLNGIVEGYQITEGIIQDKEYFIDEETGCIGECSLDYKEINEKLKDKDLQEIVNNISGELKEKLRIALMNRQKANEDGRFQADYFYGKEKKKSKYDSDIIVDFMKTLKDWTSEEDLLKAVLLTNETYKSKEVEIQEGTIYKNINEKTKIKFTKNFQKWIDKDMGDVEDMGKTTIYKNKAGEEVFQVDNDGMVSILQKGLNVLDLEKYGAEIIIESKEQNIYKNIELLKNILNEKNADILCNLSLEEKEEVLANFISKSTEKFIDEKISDEKTGLELLKVFKK